ncbi:MAG TPA: SRPBCC domain-containing protein [Rhizomicrobium sp.]|nr:SRPBCC domain-containing protein [Rhizomicrobium sp.]
MTTTFDNPVLDVVRVFDAPPERVFDAWMNKDQWEAWIGPEGCTCEITQFEPRVGGRYRLIMNLGEGRALPVVGTFKTIERPHRFAMSWGWELGKGETLVTVSLRAVGARTELTLRHEGLPTRDDREGHAKGWNSTLNKLGLYLAGGTP